MIKTQRLEIRLEEKLLRKWKRIAKKRKITLSELIRNAVTLHVIETENSK